MTTENSAPYRLDPTPEESEAFWSLVMRGSKDECWPWVGKSEMYKHYGYLKFRNHSPYWAHRLAWEIDHGVRIGNPLLVICHKCDNPPCCNPNHLFLGSNKDNQRDKAMKQRARKAMEAKR